jgi:hypothetical protein
MKKKIVASIAALHLLFILLSNLYTSYDTYCAYYEVPKDSAFCKVVKASLGNKALCYYARYTGASTGFGYFAPNVKSPTSLNCLYRGEDIQPTFNSSEAALRYDNLINALIENVNGEKLPQHEWEKKIMLTKQHYNELVFRNIASKLFSDNQLAPDAVNMQLNFVRHLPLHDARLGKTLDNPLFTVQQLKLTINNESNIN